MAGLLLTDPYPKDIQILKTFFHVSSPIAIDVLGCVDSWGDYSFGINIKHYRKDSFPFTI